MPKHISYLTPLKKSTSQAQIIAFDTEDNGQGVPNNFICACFYTIEDGKEVKKTFWNLDEARKYMFHQRKYPVIFFAHNLAYDLANMDYPEGTVKHMISGSKLVGARYEYGTQRMTKHGPRFQHVTKFMDTGNFFVGESIKSLGKIFGDYKLDFDVNRIKNKRPEDLDEQTKQEVSEYCMKDSEICYKTAQKLVDLCNEREVRFKSYTAGSLALTTFRTHYMLENWSVRNQYVNDYERSSYYGGRTEIFNYQLHPKVYYEDIVSSYPTAMTNKTFPKPWSYSILKNCKWEKIKNHKGISLVTVNVPKYMPNGELLRIPPLPYKEPKTSKLLFPYGRWTGSYVHEELIMAEKYGCAIEEVHESVLYAESFNPFKDFITHFFEKKKVTKGIEKQFNKLMMNSFSGKLGEKRESWIRIREEDFKICECKSPEFVEEKCLLCEGYNILDCKSKENRYEPNQDGWYNMCIGRKPDPTHSFPCLISYITAYGRIKLYEDQLKYQDAIYCDTDSCVSTIKHPVSIGKELGQWETKIVKNFQGYVPKLYGGSDEKDEFHMKMKGVPKNHTFVYQCIDGHKTLSEPCKGICLVNHFEESKEGKCKTCGKELDPNIFPFNYDQPVKMAEAIHRNLKPNEWKTLTKYINILDNKRIRLPNGDSEPLLINDVSSFSFREQLSKYDN